jgi:hypothetical protein
VREWLVGDAKMTTGTANRHGVSTLVALVYLLASVSAVTQDNRDKEKVRGIQTRRVAE